MNFHLSPIGQNCVQWPPASETRGDLLVKKGRMDSDYWEFVPQQIFHETDYKHAKIKNKN
jgi:hypothetical protein